MNTTTFRESVGLPKMKGSSMEYKFTKAVAKQIANAATIADGLNAKLLRKQIAENMYGRYASDVFNGKHDWCLSDAFVWAETPQGHAYWSQLYGKIIFNPIKIKKPRKPSKRKVKS